MLGFAGVRVDAGRAGAVNPAFDVTPHDLVTAIVTDRRVIRPAPRCHNFPEVVASGVVGNGRGGRPNVG